MSPASVLAQGGGFWLPEAASTVAEAHDRTFWLVFWISVFFTVLVLGLVIFFLVRYRAGHADMPSRWENLPLEVTWAVVPAVLLVVIFASAFDTFLRMVSIPDEAYEIQVTGQQWAWSFRYPNGVETTDLYVPKGEPVRLVMRSKDVIHSAYIPSFRIKQDAVPGRYTKLWFEATEATAQLAEDNETLESSDPYSFICAEYCGTSHSKMTADVHVLAVDDFRRWLKEAAKWREGKSLVEIGKILRNKKGCATCHTVDGSVKIGPSWKDVYGAKRPMEDGSSLVADANYVEESIRNPAERVVEGYPPNQMPVYTESQLSDEDIKAIIAYMKSISEKYEGDELGGSSSDE